MAKHISQAVADLEQRQRDMTAEFAKAVEAMQANTASGQQAALQSTQTAVAALSESVQQAVTMLQSQAQATAQRDEERARALATQAQSASDSLQSVLEKSHVQLGELTGAIQASVDRMEKVTTASVDKMNQGAETLYVASSDFAKASTATGALVGKAEALSQGLTAASSTLAGSSGVLANALAEYKLVRDEVQRMVTELRATVEAARREASLTAETLARIEAAANSLAVAQKQADEYLKGVSDVLSEAHSSFASNITNTLRTANGAFHEHLTNSTKILGSAIEELGDVIDRIPTPS
jgi:chromosome segregation ATPase